MKLRLNDVRLRGCGFTLFPAAKEFNVPENVIHTILTSMYFQLGALAEDFNKVQQIEQENPALPTTLTDNDIISACVSEAVDLCLLERMENGYSLTKKAISIFEKASENQKKLDDEGFHYCPCHHSCC